MKKTQVLALAFVIITINSFLHPVLGMVSPPDISAPAGILIDGETGDILYEKNAHEIMYPASTTKIMTAILTLENANLQDTIIIDKDTPFTDGNRIYAMEGEVFTVEQLLYALLVESANDAAIALAKHISGSVEDFAKLMNERAEQLGAKNTHFVNPNGLPNDAHVSTAYDLAMIAKYAMTFPKFSEIVKTARYQIPPTNKQVETRYLRSSNRFLWGVGSRNKIHYKGKWIDIKYDIVEGIKTGYTVQAQQCLVASAQKDGHRFISVVLKAQGSNIYIDSRTLIDYGIENFKFIKLVEADHLVTTVPIQGGEEKELNLITQNQLYKAFPMDETLGEIQQSIDIRKDLTAPIQQGDVVGKIIYSSLGKKLGEVALVAEKTIEAREGITTIFINETSIPKSILRIFALFICLYIGWRTFITWRRIQRKKNKFNRHSTGSRPMIPPLAMEKSHWKNKRK